MAANLLRSVSPQDVQTPYNFKVTGVNVYSFEEAIYHCFHHWKQVVDEFASDDFIGWVQDVLGLSFIATEIKNIAGLSAFSERFIRFLSIIYYFDEEDLLDLKRTLKDWESRFEWEKLKERGDYLVESGYPEKAFGLYKKALQNDEANVALLNNIGICLMHMEKYTEAAGYFQNAYAIDRTNPNVLFHLIEAYVCDGDYAKAEQYLAVSKEDVSQSIVHYFRGEICFSKGQYIPAIMEYEKAVELDGDVYSIFRLADIYSKLRQFDKALNVLQKSDTDDINFLIKQAEIYKVCNNIPAAIRCIEKALTTDHTSAKLWTLLAMYHRMDYNLEKAELSVQRALVIQNDDGRANLEFARIRKAQGKMKEYQNILRKILKAFKKSYRELLES